MMTLEFHPLANIFPLLEGEAFEELVADIKANGLREKIDLYQGKIVDGRYRYRALQRLGIDPSADPSRYFRKALYVHSVGGEARPHEQSNDDRVRAYIISNVYWALRMRYIDYRRSLGGAWETGPLLYCPTERERSARWLSIDHSQRAPLSSSQAPVIVRYR
jgi:hypothetical protein